MRANIMIFTLLAGFFLLVTVVYGGWGILTYGQVEPIGTISLGFVFILALLIGFYLGRSYKGQGGTLPEDRSDASIDDGDPELGHFSPYSWWPLVLAAAAALAFLGLAVGVWIFFIAFALFIIAIVGWVYEYYRGYFAH